MIRGDGTHQRVWRLGLSFSAAKVRYKPVNRLYTGSYREVNVRHSLSKTLHEKWSRLVRIWKILLPFLRSKALVVRLSLLTGIYMGLWRSNWPVHYMCRFIFILKIYARVVLQ